MLAQTLHTLERDGFVHRNARPVIPPHVDYTVTETGREAGERMRAMIQWVEGRMSTVVDARAAYDQARAERDAAAEAPPVTGTH